MAKNSRRNKFAVVGNNAMAVNEKEDNVMDQNEYMEFLEWKQQKQDAEAKPQTLVETEQPNGQAEQNDPAPTPQVVQLEKPKIGFFKKIGNGFKAAGGKIGKIAKKVFEVVGVITLIAGGGYAIYRVATRDEDGNDVPLDITERDGKYYYLNPENGELGDECTDENLINAIKESQQEA